MAALKNISTPLKKLQRLYSQVKINPFITFTTNKEIRNSTQFTLSDFEAEGRPLVVIFPWILAKKRSVQRFEDFYLSQNFDVLTLHSSTPLQLLKTKQYDKILQTEVIPTLLSSKNYQNKLIHGFSVGGYIFTQTLKYIRDSRKEGEKFQNSIRAQVWDSVADWTKVGKGTIIAALPPSTPDIVRNALATTSETCMRHILGEKTKHYEEAQQRYIHNPAKASALFFISEIDELVSIEAVQKCRSFWEKAGITTELKLWTDDQMVGHNQGYRKYPDEYKNILTRFLKKNGFPVKT